MFLQESVNWKTNSFKCVQAACIRSLSLSLRGAAPAWRLPRPCQARRFPPVPPVAPRSSPCPRLFVHRPPRPALSRPATTRRPLVLPRHSLPAARPASPRTDIVLPSPVAPISPCPRLPPLARCTACPWLLVNCLTHPSPSLLAHCLSRPAPRLLACRSPRLAPWFLTRRSSHPTRGSVPELLIKLNRTSKLVRTKKTNNTQRLSQEFLTATPDGRLPACPPVTLLSPAPATARSPISLLHLPVRLFCHPTHFVPPTACLSAALHRLPHPQPVPDWTG